MKITEAANVLYQRNKEAAEVNAKRRAGNLFNERLIKLVTPKLPMMVRGYKDEPWFKFVLINTFAVVAIKMGSKNETLLQITDAAIDAANNEFLGSFNLEEIINKLIDGIDLSPHTEANSTTVTTQTTTKE